MKTRERQDAWERWVAGVRPRLLRMAHRILRDLPEAENVVQETLLAVWQADRGGKLADLEAYARRGVWLNSLRHRARQRAFEPLDGAASEIPVELDELGAWEVETALQGLPPAQQMAIRLRFYAGLSFKEIGQALSISINTAASRYRYGLEALRESMAARTKEQDDGTNE